MQCGDPLDVLQPCPLLSRSAEGLWLLSDELVRRLVAFHTQVCAHLLSYFVAALPSLFSLAFPVTWLAGAPRPHTQLAQHNEGEEPFAVLYAEQQE